MELEFDLERIREVVMSPNLEQMRTLIEDIYDWEDTDNLDQKKK